MANRSYLYTTDFLPDSPEWQEKLSYQGIGEWNYDTPLTFQLLASAEPIAIKTSIWEMSGLVAIAGNAPEQAKPLVMETKEFFSNPNNVKKYFVLECAELFMMSCETDEEIAEQNSLLLAEIKSLGDNVLTIPLPENSYKQEKKEGIFSRFFVSKDKTDPSLDPLKPYYPLGFGNWSNVLYFDFSDGNDEN